MAVDTGSYGAVDYYMMCDNLKTVMTTLDLRQGRLNKGLSQTQAARHLGVSQPYLAMLERGRRPLTPKLTWKAVRVYGLSPAALPHSTLAPRPRVDAGSLVRDLCSLGYPGFSYSRPRRRKLKNPGDVLLAALAQPELEARLVEALPWLLLKYADVDRQWLVKEAKAHDLQNRLGFVASLACSLAEKANDQERAQALRTLQEELEHSRLVREDTFGKASVPEPERRWLEQHRPEAARHWNVLTDWTADTLRYATV
jgi:transcriptional regulator with XRE-family HTH domain